MPVPGPKQSLCPRCGKRPRRGPGLYCNACNTERQRAYRKRWSKGEKLERVNVETEARFARPLNAKRYLITCAQNATPVDDLFLDALEVAAKAMGAELVIVPIRYKNPTSIWSSKQEADDWWAPRTAPYLFNARKKLGPNLVLCADVPIQPTAVSPLAGFDALTGAESCILAHPKMALRTVPVPSGRLPKILSTTGACTKRNFTKSRAGALGAFHHCLGAVVVELSGQKFFLRQINADRADGSFIDLDRHYSSRGVKRAPPALGLVTGDTHARWACPKVDRATFGKRGIVETLNPETIVFHDLFDGDSVNHHHAGDPFIAHAKAEAKHGDPRAEVAHAVEFVRARTKGRKAVIVASNHDNFLARWVRSTDWRFTGSKEFYLETALAMLRSARMTPNGYEAADPFAYWVDQLKGDAPIRCLAVDESFKLGDVECSMHGDRGPNGARGSIRNLARLGVKAISGHTHSPGIEEGHYKGGTSGPLRPDYARGPSGWLNAHVAVYASRKRAILVIVDGRWRAAA